MKTDQNLKVSQTQCGSPHLLEVKHSSYLPHRPKTAKYDEDGKD